MVVRNLILGTIEVNGLPEPILGTSEVEPLPSPSRCAHEVVPFSKLSCDVASRWAWKRFAGRNLSLWGGLRSNAWCAELLL
jgi:hypothetical protein